jgi:hypothetical protein
VAKLVCEAISKQHGVQCREACALDLKTDSFERTQSGYSHRFGCPGPAKSMIWKLVKQSRYTRNVNIPKRVRWSTAVTVTRITGVSERPSATAQVIAASCTTNWNVAQ